MDISKRFSEIENNHQTKTIQETQNLCDENTQYKKEMADRGFKWVFKECHDTADMKHTTLTHQNSNICDNKKVENQL